MGCAASLCHVDDDGGEARRRDKAMNGGGGERARRTAMQRRTHKQRGMAASTDDTNDDDDDDDGGNAVALHVTGADGGNGRMAYMQQAYLAAAVPGNGGGGGGSNVHNGNVTAERLARSWRGPRGSDSEQLASRSPEARAGAGWPNAQLTPTAAAAPYTLQQQQQQQQPQQLQQQQQQQPQPPPPSDGMLDTGIDVVRAPTPLTTSAHTMSFHDALLVISQQLSHRQRDGAASVTKEEMEHLVLVTRELESLKQVMRRSKYTVVGTWNIVESENMLERLAQQLYDELLTHNPRLRVYFYGVDIEEQSRTLLRMLSTAVHFYDKPQAMVDMLTKAGARHRGYGVTRETFVSMQNAFMAVFPKFIGQDIFDAAEEEWKKFWKLILDLLEHGSCSSEGERYGHMYEMQNMKKLQSDFRLLLERQERCDVRHQFVGVMFAKAMELYHGDVSRPEAQAQLRAGRQIVEGLLNAIQHFVSKEQAYATMRALGARHAAHGLVSRDTLQQLSEPFLFASRHFLEDEWNVAMESRFLALFQYMIDGVATGLDDAANAPSPASPPPPPPAPPQQQNYNNGKGTSASRARRHSNDDDEDDRTVNGHARGAAVGNGYARSTGNGSAPHDSRAGTTPAVTADAESAHSGNSGSTSNTGNNGSSSSSSPGSATFCLLFTDIEASTRLWQKDADVMAAAVAAYQRVVRQLIAEYGAYEVKMVKDSFIVACKDVLVGAKLALAIQLELMRVAPIAAGFRMVDNTEGRGDASVWDERTLRLRISLEHCTDAVATYDEKRNCYEYYGPSVNRGARILSVTCGGQILMSRQTFEQLMATPAFHHEPCPATLRDVHAPPSDAKLDSGGGALDHYVAVCDIGAVRLKGVSEPVRLVSMVPRCFVGRLFVDKIGRLALRESA